MLNILLVEDDEVLSSAIREKLLDEGFSVSCAFDGKQAAEALDEAHFDLIISDVMMPRTALSLADTLGATARASRY